MNKALVIFAIFAVLPVSTQAQPGPALQVQQKLKPLPVKIPLPENCEGPGNLMGPSQIYPPQVESRTYNGVSFTITTKRMRFNDQVCLTTDLTDLMSKIPAIVASSGLPTNPCASYIKNNPVIDVYNAALKPAMGAGNTTLSFEMNGKMTPWTCKPGPPNISTKLVKVGCCLWKPQVTTSPGPDIKTVLIVEPFTETLDFRLVASGGSVGPVLNGSTLPFFSFAVPQVDMTTHIVGALAKAVPSFGHQSAPLNVLEGQQYSSNLSYIWGTM